MSRIGIGLSYRPASLCSLATQFQTRSLESIPRPIAGITLSDSGCTRTAQSRPETQKGQLGSGGGPQSTHRGRRNRGSVPALSAKAYTTILFVIVDIAKGGGRATPTLTRLGWVFHHDGKYARKWPLPLCVYSVGRTYSFINWILVRWKVALTLVYLPPPIFPHMPPPPPSHPRVCVCWAKIWRGGLPPSIGTRLRVFRSLSILSFSMIGIVPLPREKACVY